MGFVKAAPTKDSAWRGYRGRRKHRVRNGEGAQDLTSEVFHQALAQRNPLTWLRP